MPNLKVPINSANPNAIVALPNIPIIPTTHIVTVANILTNIFGLFVSLFLKISKIQLYSASFTGYSKFNLAKLRPVIILIIPPIKNAIHALFLPYFIINGSNVNIPAPII